MAEEQRAIPEIAKTALELERAKFQIRVAELMRQTMDAMGLKPDEGWVVDFTNGFARRQVPDEISKALAPPVQKSPAKKKGEIKICLI